MKTCIAAVGFAVLSLALAPGATNAETPMDPDATGVRVLLGVGDKEPARWDGTVKLSAGEVRDMAPWRFRPDDKIIGRSGWRTFSHRINTNAMSASGVVLTLAAPRSASLEIETAQGKFSVPLGEVEPGKRLSFLNERVQVDGVAPTVQITRGDTEDDCPAAAAAPDGGVWVAFIRHTHRGPAHLPLLEKPPKDFSFLVPQGGGDQLMLTRFDGESWSAPVALTAGGLDVWRPAVAADSQGRVHVVWSQQETGNWDLLEQVVDASGAKIGNARRLTTKPGSDVDAVLATDKAGRIWMAWQAWRNGQADIWLTSLDDAAKAVRVTDSPANDWSPAIACDDQGRLHIAYDTYAAGNHDVYLRTFADGKLSAPVAVATSSRFEARPSIACDDNGRVWIAYEQRAADWGKDFGPLASLQGSPLYQRGASVQVRVVSNGKLQQPASDLTKQLPPQLQRFNSYPRLALDGQGRPWLLFRHRHEAFWGLCAQMMVGGVWFEYATSFDGEKWTPPVFLPASDNLLDVRPALARTRGGRLLAIYPSDGRLRHEAIGSEQQRKTFFVTAGTSVAGQAKNDLFAAALPALEKTKPAQWTSAQANQPGFAGLGPDQELHRAAKPIEADPESKQLHPNTAADIQRLRDHVIEAGGKKYRLLRGEFHRHTELSADGGNDGSLEDMWRYALDAADFDWMGNGDHDSGGGREYSWWLQQKLADVYNQPPRFVAMFTYERSNPYPNGHRNCMFDRRGVRTLPRLIGDDPGGISTNDTRMLYAYLNQLGGVCASHTSGTGMGTDWRDNDAAAEPIVEIYQGCRNSYEALGGPRVARKQGEVIGGWRPLGMVWNAMAMGYKMGFQASSDHVSTHISYAVAIAEDRSRAAVLDAFRKRRCYGATDNIVLDVRMGDHIMGEEFTVGPGQKPPLLSVRVIGTAPIARIDVVKDFHYVHTAEPKKASVSFTWADSELGPGVSWYYVRAVQTDGQVAWGSPIWVKSPQPQAGKRKGNR